MKMRHKGKIHPSTSSSPFLHSLTKNAQSVLKLLPATILAIALVLPLEDREVLAYMITRSINIASFTEENTEKNRGEEHKGPLFHCECFDCYISYWFRWDCSPNRELIHQAIEAFEEEGLNNGEEYRTWEEKNVEKNGFCGVEKILVFPEAEGMDLAAAPEIQERGVIEKGSPGNEVSGSGLELADFVSESGESSELMELEAAEEVEVEVVVRGRGGNSQKGLARKVLTHMLGLFSFRLWSLWKIEAE